ncbi:MAG: hypothetical protein HWQ38_07955 [Nostoc sp. NMS7]|uniref:hypothetical protein n=1 Tax=Nostoc sp. NMS7 TaxID=2815391 RepID=UPI0025DE5DE0|nr:hypothetical protein [Nostoc sp. NMS7]MBN3946415.1 hypothetical protein [Nostoc sp. NMS7]
MAFAETANSLKQAFNRTSFGTQALSVFVMGLNVSFFQLRGYAFKQDAISFGDGESIDVDINRSGTITKIPITKKTATFSLVGATDTDLVSLQNERDNNIAGLINGSVTGEDIDILGYIVRSAVLTKVTPTAPINVNGFNIFDKIELLFESQVYS